MKIYENAKDMILDMESTLDALKQIAKEDFHSYHRTQDGKTFILVVTKTENRAIVFHENDGSMTLQELHNMKGPFIFVGVSPDMKAAE